MIIRRLTLDDLDAWVAHFRVHDAESGTTGELPYGPYSGTAPFDGEGLRQRTEQRWSAPLDAAGWRRAWGAFDGARLVAHVDLTGGHIPTEMHRVNVGLGVERPYRRRGVGRALMVACIDWARAEPAIAWIDLGVFAGNDGAKALYQDLGFSVIGQTRDRFRVDGRIIDDISMTLAVG